MITLYHHPFSRAAGVVWALEELGQPYELKFVDIMKGAHKAPEFLKLNPMGKLPALTDGDAVVTEGAAINLYLADRYALGTLAPAVDDPRRGTYLRWSLFAPSVIEPGSMARAQKWEFKASQAGWGDYDTMIAAISGAVAQGPFVLGEMFSMADVIFGGTVRFMTMFGMMKPTPEIAAYLEKLNARPALQRADAKNQAVMKEHDLKLPGQ
ncbi:MAG TPA: glutathione S-transferase [Kofleriaceae bacterium]|jgi:glutathione S-transferase|nr:glutathione S-transferase [Kofleriaceae bacterium]